MDTATNQAAPWPYSPPPELPPEAQWPFEQELNRPLHVSASFALGKPPKTGELDLRSGLVLQLAFPNPEGQLETAYTDFHEFLTSLTMNAKGDDACPVVIESAKDFDFEEFRISVDDCRIVLTAGDTEGVRRGLIQLEDMILARDRCSLPLGETHRKPVVRTRLSRCFHGPINRPPLCRDELLEGREYYSDGYLNRLAHHGINALWLTIRFSELSPSQVLPELGSGSARRLNKLRQTVQQCARYGIRIYPFCIEPAALPNDSPVLKSHPELKGASAPGDRSLFCTSSETGQDYLEDAARTLFTEVPGLGGLICIPVGERFTHCYSGRLAIDCPRCAQRKPWQVLADTLAALERGMHSVNEKAELVAWPYGQLVVWGAEHTAEAAGHMPPGVVLQHNFETGGQVKQLGKFRPLWDYWLSWVGPSKNFSDCANAAVKNGTRVFAKLQTSCSHEVATTQYVPVPGIMYRKYKKMHDLGVDGVMQGWYFGNYPSVMTKASGMLSFAPLARTEEQFLRNLAAPAWGRHAPQVVKAWQHFTDGYTHYPGAQVFSYYGPMHDGVVWPLYLEPRHLPLSPTWRIVHPPSGDEVGECVSKDFEYDEILILCKALRDYWRKGVDILHNLEKHGDLDSECHREINVARALGVQFDSTYNILLFYHLRDQLAAAETRSRQATLLERLEQLVADEMKNDEILLKLCAENPTLGFHSEAEGYKYFPEKIKWRIQQLQTLLEVEFPKVAEQIGCYPMPVFENYIGKGDSIRSHSARHTRNGPYLAANPFAPEWSEAPRAACRFWAAPLDSEAKRPFPFNSTLHPVPRPENAPPEIQWRSAWNDSMILFCVSYPNTDTADNTDEHDEIRIVLQPKRLGPAISLTICKTGEKWLAKGPDKLDVHAESKANETRVTVAVPWHRLDADDPGADGREAIRVNVACFFSAITDVLCFSGNPLMNSWAPMRQTMPRNLFGYHDPAAYGWLILDGHSSSPNPSTES